MGEQYGPRTVRPEIVPEQPSAFPERPAEAQPMRDTEVHPPEELEPRIPAEPAQPAPPPAPRLPDPRG